MVWPCMIWILILSTTSREICDSWKRKNSSNNISYKNPRIQCIIALYSWVLVFLQRKHLTEDLLPGGTDFLSFCLGQPCEDMGRCQAVCARRHLASRLEPRSISLCFISLTGFALCKKTEPQSRTYKYDALLVLFSYARLIAYVDKRALERERDGHIPYPHTASYSQNAPKENTCNFFVTVLC